MANRRFTQFYSHLHKRLIQLDCVFQVNSTDSGGYGQVGLKGPGIAQVFMNTTATVAAASVGNPNPQAGFAVVKLQDNYKRLYDLSGIFRPILSGTDVPVHSSGAPLTVGNVYVISVLGTTTAADWLALGVPAGISAAVGVPFVAKTTGTGTGTGQAQVVKSNAAVASEIEVLGDPELTLTSSAGGVMGQANGAFLMLAFIGATNSSVTTRIPIAPPDGTWVRLRMSLGDSMITNNGD